MIDDRSEAKRKVVVEVADWRNRDALEAPIEVPMFQPMRIARDDRRFIAMRVISMIAVAIGTVTFVVVLVMVLVRFTRSVVVMDVRIVSPAVPMMNQTRATPPLHLAK
jgi:hypothetical protein